MQRSWAVPAPRSARARRQTTPWPYGRSGTAMRHAGGASGRRRLKPLPRARQRRGPQRPGDALAGAPNAAAKLAAPGTHHTSGRSEAERAKTAPRGQLGLEGAASATRAQRPLRAYAAACITTLTTSCAIRSRTSHDKTSHSQHEQALRTQMTRSSAACGRRDVASPPSAPLRDDDAYQPSSDARSRLHIDDAAAPSVALPCCIDAGAVSLCFRPSPQAPASLPAGRTRPP